MRRYLLFNILAMDCFTLVGLGACTYILIYGICLWFIDCNLELAFAEKFGKRLSKLKRKVVWVTQASTDLGKCLSKKVAQHHGKLIISSTSLKELEKLKTTCLKINPFLKTKDIFILLFDIKELHTHESSLEKIISHFKRLDIIIVNEDKWEQSPWEQTSLASDKSLFHANVFGVLSLTRLAVKYFSLHQKGKLAVTSSIAGLIGVPYSGSYTAAKHALHGYFDSLRTEKLGYDIQITLLCLGSSKITQQKISSNFRKNLEADNNLKQNGSKWKMPAERYAQLCLTAIVNDLDEVWMAIFPILPLIYGIKYYPNITKIVLKFLKPKKE